MNAEPYRSKPPELLNLYDPTSEIFNMIKREFKVDDTYTLALHDVDAAEPLLTDTRDVAAIVMRKIQTLRWVAKSGVETSNDVVVTLAADLQRHLEYLSECCINEKSADALNVFKRQVVVAARRVAGNGDIDWLH
jgi:hypothetical protein